MKYLKSLNLRNRGVKIISCPSCARQGFQVIDTVKILEEKLSHIKTPITFSIIGCVVNGPGEAAQTDIGITGGGKDSNMLYLNGIQTEKLDNQEIVSKIVDLVEKKLLKLKKIKMIPLKKVEELNIKNIKVLKKNYHQEM